MLNQEENYLNDYYHSKSMKHHKMGSMSYGKMGANYRVTKDLSTLGKGKKSPAYSPEVGGNINKYKKQVLGKSC